MTRPVLTRLNDSRVVAVRCRGHAWPRALLSETPIPDTWMGLVVRPDGCRRFVPAGEDPHPDDDDTLVLVRNRAITVPLTVRGAPAADGHTVQAQVELLVRCPPRDHEIAAFAADLLGDAELTLDALARALEAAGAPAALRTFIRDHPAARLVQEDLREPLLAHLRRALKDFLFSAGLVLERLGTVSFASRSWDEQVALEHEAARRKRELEARNVVEEAARAATRRRLDDLSSILAKLKAAAAAADGTLQWHALLPALSPGERGRLLENLWRITPDRHVASAIVVITSTECLWLSPQSAEEISRRVALPPELGGLRSVSFDLGRSWLLLGAATGVWVLAAQDGSVVARYAVPSAGQPRTGFNSAAIVGGRLVATHSQLGVWSWNLGDPQDVRPLIQPVGGTPKTIRCATAAPDGHLLLAADDAVHVFAPAGEPLGTLPTGRGPIHGVAVLGDNVYVSTADGLVLRDAWRRPNIWEVLHRRSEPIESIQVRRWDDLVEVVIPAGPDGVLGIYEDEGMVARLMTASVPIRRVWACDDTLVALTENRDRLVIANANMPGRQGLDLPLARRLGHSLQDACLLIAPAAGPPVASDLPSDGSRISG